MNRARVKSAWFCWIFEKFEFCESPSILAGLGLEVGREWAFL